MKELDFFCGYHGSGKTYTANKLLTTFDAELADCGPIIRRTFQESCVDNFDNWVRQQEIESGENWDDILILIGIKSRIGKNFEPRRYLFIVGNRSLKTIDFLKEELSDGEVDKVIFFEKPFAVIKSGYEYKTGKHLTDDEFLQILHSDEQMGLLEVRRYVESNPETNSIIKSDRYDIDSIELTSRAILRNRQT